MAAVKHKPCDQPLVVEVEGGQLVIRIGIDTLAFAAAHGPRFYVRSGSWGDGPFFKITDKMAFARDVARALQHEEEDGSGPLTKLFDDMIEAAYDDGSEGVDYDE